MLLGWTDPLQEIADALVEEHDWGDLYHLIEDMVECEQALTEKVKLRAQYLADEKPLDNKTSVLEQLKKAVFTPAGKSAKQRGEER